MNSSMLARRWPIGVAGALWAGAAAAHPGHDHVGWMADIAHLLHAFAPLLPLLALLAVGVGGTVTWRLLDRERR